MTSATSATSEGAQGIFSKITFLKSVHSNEKDEVCHSFVVEIFTKSLHKGGVPTLMPLRNIKMAPKFDTLIMVVLLFPKSVTKKGRNFTINKFLSYDFYLLGFQMAQAFKM